MKKIYVYILILLLIIFGGYYFVFGQEKIMDNSDFLSICKFEKNINVKLAVGTSYITDYSSKIDEDTLLIEVVSTSIGNIFNSKKDIEFNTLLDEKVNYVKLCNSIYKISDLNSCNPSNLSIDEALEKLEE